MRGRPRPKDTVRIMAFGKRKTSPRTYTEAQLFDYAVGALGQEREMAESSPAAEEME